MRAALTIFIAFVWFTNGLCCKVLNLVPRHQQIVARILGAEYALTLTLLIGLSEILIAIWVISRIKSRFCAIFQMAVVGTMNIIEFIAAPDLLLFGRLNIVFAMMFVVIIYVHEFVVMKSGVVRHS